MKKLIAIIVLLVIISGGYYWLREDQTVDNNLNRFLVKEVFILAETSILENKFFIESFDGRSRLIGLYVAERPSGAEVEELIKSLASKITDQFGDEHYYNFAIFPKDSIYFSGGTEVSDAYYNVAWREGRVVFPVY